MNPIKRVYPSKDPIVKLKEEMKLRGLSPKSVKSYSYYVQNCLSFHKKSALQITGQDVRAYLSFLADQKRSSSTLNTAYSALHFYFSKILRRRFFFSIPRSKKEKSLPTVLSTGEVKQLIASTKNLKHRTMIALLYGAGLRVSELVHLKMKHFDFDRDRILVAQAKGKKDRYTLLPLSLKTLLQKQLTLKTPNDFLFTNSRGKHLTRETIAKVVKRAANHSGITKNVHPHTLRHSFATHLLEQGTDIRFISELLGHSKLETTRLYTHVAIGEKNIMSPLDI